MRYRLHPHLWQRLGKHIVGNWKMNGSAAMVESLVRALKSGIADKAFQQGGAVTLCPPFPYLRQVAELISGTSIGLAGQNCHAADAGAFTGEVSPPMLRDCGAAWCLIGHSERRQIFGESDPLIRQKLDALIAHGIHPILCVGETLADRESERAEEIVWLQLDAALSNLPQASANELTVAYEPVWAIGTGRTASPQQAQEMHAFIRRVLAERMAAELARGIPVLYGGSVNPANARELMQAPDIDGVLVGGASLKADQFLAIIEQATA